MFLLLANRDEVSVSKQKREAIAALLQENPQRSDRAIAKQAKVSHHTVAKVRTEMETTGRTRQSAQSVVPGGQLGKRAGLDGKARKGSRGKVRAEIEANGKSSHKGDGLVGEHLFQPEAVRPASEMAAKLRNGIEVRLLRRRRQIADHHVVDHAPAQRANLSHRKFLSNEVVQQSNPLRQETRRQLPLLRSGFVVCRACSIARR